MTFEKVLPELKAGKKAVRQGWDGSEEYIFVVSDDTRNGETINPYFLIRTKEEPALSQFMPNSCDILADDWKLVE
ncbi:hypothetical protein FC65_GL002223 [Ligilactobacillus acidipiscis DSM 15836]|jgi:hypothetical protein|uniref:DUF2829 domain-containing protein n=2 Tax=Ligilactobacillus acidipiscis TaxID=89059 RepID=A0A0R2K895_9LACO|nr:DUF2829 domain-containing protein [Ligilactobacillus acidipiscis]KRM31266.1 hypothetical protein FC65_GL002223 [Ligilactobacillus acidipiscis DSM 15836]KRN85595.1 hypothetical protein IV43_GL000909 [Ligilactobacillus acidipiscis]MCI1924942.1 DUF2829 domain-containing protein [Ligilactobacillus acidipiscis]MCI1954645.1 DUF2829 domain-containing protein [Ligilactobacillus acidipiscis]WEV57404.1 DUF2829 domain-containing protein [Ligilactobacillus acidipiscis]